jgi:hypothetical protein
MQFLFLLHLSSTFFMVGLIWFVQTVHYPLHAYVGNQAFTNYQNQHMTRTGLIVGLPMLVEALTTVYFLLNPFHPVPDWAFEAGGCLLFLIWAFTGLVQVPLHHSLSIQFDSEIHKRLVLTNWVRTIFWTARGVIVLYILSALINI